MGVAFTFGTLHVLLVQSDVSVNPYLKYYLLSLSVLGILVYCYRTLFGSALVKRHTFTVLAVEKVGADVWNVRMRNPADKFSYLPGQFVFVSFYGMGISDEVHPFSISSSPTDIDLTLTIKSSGDFTKNLGNLRPGNTAKIEGPFGRFFSGKQKNQIWIAGGIGVTPFLSKARSLHGLQYLVDLYYVVRGEADAVYLNDLLTIAAREPNLRVCLYDTTVEKRITAEIIRNVSGDVMSKEIFICGPPPMMKSLRKQFTQLGVHNNQIHSEEFELL
jgi:predicted ferric reductase